MLERTMEPGARIDRLGEKPTPDRQREPAADSNPLSRWLNRAGMQQSWRLTANCFGQCNGIQPPLWIAWAERYSSSQFRHGPLHQIVTSYRTGEDRSDVQRQSH